MPPKVSAEMKEALRLVRSGMMGREAAQQAGVREESLYRHAEYKTWRKDKLEVRNGIEESIEIDQGTGKKYYNWRYGGYYARAECDADEGEEASWRDAELSFVARSFARMIARKNKESESEIQK